MPFGRRWQFDFPNGTPWPMKAAFAALLANFAGFLTVDLWAEFYAKRQPSPLSPFPIHFKGGLIVFVPSWVGLYEQWSFGLHFAFLGLLGAMFWWYERTGQAVRVR